MSRRDASTGDLFAVPQPAAPVSGAMDYRTVMAHLLAEMLRESSRDRYAVAAEASRLAGKELSKYMLDAYTAESRETFNAPAWAIPALETACGSHRITSWLAGVRGGRLLIGREALNAELGRLERQRDEAGQQIRALRDQLRRSK